MKYSVGRQVVEEAGTWVVEVVVFDNTPSSPCSAVGRHSFVADIRFAPGNQCSLAVDHRGIGLHREDAFWVSCMLVQGGFSRVEHERGMTNMPE